MIHPLGKDLPERIDPVELEGMVERLRFWNQCDLSEEMEAKISDTICVAHIRLGLYIANKFAKTYKNKDGDLVSESVRGIVYAVSRAASRLRDNNITPYITTNIKRFIKTFLEKEVMVSCPRTTKARKKAKGEKTFDIFVRLDLPMLKRFDSVLKRANVSLGKFTLTEKDIVEGVDSAIKSLEKDQDIAKQTIYLRTLGYTDKEIADILGYSNAHINRLRNKVEDKFNNYVDGLDK